ncbi:MAG: DUF452 family protein [Odoribacter sp.]|nr:DUF452 family protein [Odoribacter sp.]
MRIEWLNKTGNGRVILFFNGWGMDGQAVKHLKCQSDVLMFYDYRSLELGALPDLGAYREVIIVAWSMGVWATAQFLTTRNIRSLKQIALNGTERPVDDHYGIPVRVYALTEKGMTEKGREKFVARMLDGRTEHPVTEFTCRPIGEVCEELSRIREKSAVLQSVLAWDKVYISEQDVIFPVAGQQAWWTERGAKIQMLSGGHFPFFQFESWEEIVGE